MTIALCHLLDTANAKDVDAEEEEEEEEKKSSPILYITTPDQPASAAVTGTIK